MRPNEFIDNFLIAARSEEDADVEIAKYHCGRSRVGAVAEGESLTTSAAAEQTEY